MVVAGGREVRVSSPDRVIYEATDTTPEVTKVMVAEYFASVEAQRRLAPHLHAAVRGTIPRRVLREVALDGGVQPIDLVVLASQRFGQLRAVVPQDLEQAGVFNTATIYLANRLYADVTFNALRFRNEAVTPAIAATAIAAAITMSGICRLKRAARNRELV